MVEIISIHIPKTAGKTFQKILQEIYADKLDPRHGRKHFFPKKILRNRLQTAPGITVVHGHLHYKNLSSMRWIPKVGQCAKL